MLKQCDDYKIIFRKHELVKFGDMFCPNNSGTNKITVAINVSGKYNSSPRKFSQIIPCFCYHPIYFNRTWWQNVYFIV